MEAEIEQHYLCAQQHDMTSDRTDEGTYREIMKILNTQLYLSCCYTPPPPTYVQEAHSLQHFVLT
jgi:hypothetical protein